MLADPSFGVTSPVFLDELTPAGRPIGSVQVPDGSSQGRLVTSFSSKSELAGGRKRPQGPRLPAARENNTNERLGGEKACVTTQGEPRG